MFNDFWSTRQSFWLWTERQLCRIIYIVETGLYHWLTFVWLDFWSRAKPLFFGQKLNFSGRSQQPNMKNCIY